MRVPLAIAALPLLAQAEVYLHEDFNSESWEDQWVSPDDSGLGRFERATVSGDDMGLKTTQDAKFYMAARPFDKTFDNEGKTMVVQISVKHEQNIDCGGGYVKIYAPGVDLETLNGDSPYNIMFGPDICGNSKKMTHVILSNDGENHLINKKIACETDAMSHVYTLILKPDNSYEVLIDNKVKESGTLAEDWSILAPKEINDPNESKPADWVDSPRMDDPSETKPEDWPEETIPDEEAEKPEDWDDDMDGEYEVPMIVNPEFPGEWFPTQIENPDYQGSWVHPQIANPDFKDDDSLYHYESFAVGLDLWQVKSGTIFDKLLVTDDVDFARTVAEETIAIFKLEMKDEVQAQEAQKADQLVQQQIDDDFQDEDFDDIDDDLEHDEL